MFYCWMLYVTAAHRAGDVAQIISMGKSVYILINYRVINTIRTSDIEPS